MLTTLDFWLFGNGHGLAQPYFDGRFFWLVNTAEGRERGRGRLYTFFGGHGAQLRSIEWFLPHPGERRRLAGESFTVFQAHRKGPRVEVAWCMRLPDGIDAANAKIRALENRLCHGLLWDNLDLEAEMRETARLREQGRAWEREAKARAEAQSQTQESLA